MRGYPAAFVLAPPPFLRYVYRYIIDHFKEEKDTPMGGNDFNDVVSGLELDQTN